MFQVALVASGLIWIVSTGLALADSHVVSYSVWTDHHQHRDRSPAVCVLLFYLRSPAEGGVDTDDDGRMDKKTICE